MGFQASLAVLVQFLCLSVGLCVCLCTAALPSFNKVGKLDRKGQCPCFPAHVVPRGTAQGSFQAVGGRRALGPPVPPGGCTPILSKPAQRVPTELLSRVQGGRKSKFQRSAVPHRSFRQRSVSESQTQPGAPQRSWPRRFCPQWALLSGRGFLACSIDSEPSNLGRKSVESTFFSGLSVTRSIFFFFCSGISKLKHRKHRADSE